MVAVADVHVFDEAHDDAAAAEALQQIKNGVVVHAPLYDGVDLDGRESGAARVFDALQHLLDAAEAAAHAREDLRVEAVEAHGDAVQAGGLELGGVTGLAARRWW